MKLTQIDNACCIYEEQGFRLLTDPWLTDGAFEGSWFHYPPLVTTFDFVKDVDALYISHLHPDHFDETTLKKFRNDLPIVLLDKTPNYLKRKLEALGFTNLILVKDKETTSLGPLELTLYAPFCKHPFDDSMVGNLIDSAIVVKAKAEVILNANDNTPTNEAAKMLFERHGKFTVVQLQDSLAGAYPSCFKQLSDAEKLSEAKRLIERMLTRMCEVAELLQAEWFQPFAGDYQLGGKLAEKNPYLGVSGKLFSAQFIASKGIKPLVLSEQSWIDLTTHEVKAAYREFLAPYRIWKERVSAVRYDWENDQFPEPDQVMRLCEEALQNLRAVQQKYDYWPDTWVKLNDYMFYLGKKPLVGKAKMNVTFTLDNRLLFRILTRRAHFNNAEIGAHIEIERNPNTYEPDLSVLMSFFHA